jgi:hypothetical protein
LLWYLLLFRLLYWHSCLLLCWLLESFLTKIFKLLIGVGSEEKLYNPSPLKILMLSICLGFIFLAIITFFIITTGLILWRK